MKKREWKNVTLRQRLLKRIPQIHVGCILISHFYISRFCFYVILKKKNLFGFLHLSWGG